MAEPQKQQIGDGSDNYPQAATQAAKAARNIGKEAATQATKKGTEAAANAAASIITPAITVFFLPMREAIKPMGRYETMADAVAIKRVVL